MPYKQYINHPTIRTANKPERIIFNVTFISCCGYGCDMNFKNENTCNNYYCIGCHRTTVNEFDKCIISDCSTNNLCAYDFENVLIDWSLHCLCSTSEINIV